MIQSRRSVGSSVLVASVTEFRVPLELVCKQGTKDCIRCTASANILDSVPAQKTATNFKLSIDSASEALEIGTLFPGTLSRYFIAVSPYN